MSIDLECWHDLMLRYAGYPSQIHSLALLRQMDAILEVLSATNTKCTFFVLANIAEQHPEMLQRLVATGHEIGIHGTAHRPLFLHDAASLRADLAHCKTQVEKATGVQVVSHRAPMFSILEKNLWALDVLAEIGISVDSSIFPMRLPRYGIDGFPRTPQSMHAPAGGKMFEVPLSIVSALGKRWPVSGGGYARVSPPWLLGEAVRRLEAEGLPLVLYFHPYELDPEPLAAPRELGWKQRTKLSLKWNLNRKSIRKKLEYLLKNFSFGTMQEYINAHRN